MNTGVLLRLLGSVDLFTGGRWWKRKRRIPPLETPVFTGGSEDFGGRWRTIPTLFSKESRNHDFWTDYVQPHAGDAEEHPLRAGAEQYGQCHGAGALKP